MSIQKRVYKTRGRGGRTATRTAWRVRWVDEGGAHRSQQFDYHADAVAFEAETKLPPADAPLTPQPAATPSGARAEVPAPSMSGWLIDEVSRPVVSASPLIGGGLTDSLGALSLLGLHAHDAMSSRAHERAREEYNAINAIEQAVEAAPAQSSLIGRDPLIVTLGDVWREWLPLYKPTVASTTAETNETLWNTHVAGVLDALPIADFTTTFPAQQLLASMKSSKVGNASIRKTMSVLKMVIDSAVAWRLITFNGTRGFHLGRKVSAKRKRDIVMLPALKVEKIRLMILARTNGAPGFTAEQHARRMVCLLGLEAYEGLRPAEAYALTWRDFNELKSELAAGERVADGDEADPKTPTSNRRLHIIKPLLDDLKAWRDITPYPAPDAPIICDQDGAPFGKTQAMSFSRNVLTPLAKKVGIDKIRQYDLRHTWCMSQIKCGWDLLELAVNAGSLPDTIAAEYLSQPRLQRDLDISDDVESFEAWVINQRTLAAAPDQAAATGT